MAKNKTDVEMALKTKPPAPAVLTAPNVKSIPNHHKQMRLALEQLAGGGRRDLPLFTRGPEVELTTR